MTSVASMCMVALALAVVSPVLGPRAASAQEMAPAGGMMMHGTMVEGVITRIRYASCGSTPDTCQAIIQIAPSSKGSLSGEASMMHQPAMAGETMMGPHPVTVIIVPGTALMGQNQNAPLPLTRLRVGDTVAVEYRTLGGMNVVTKVALTGMGHM